jgi:sulfide:quinone oxidoreductase
MPTPSNALPRILVLGAGLGGTIAAYEIRDATKGRAQVMVVSDSEDYWFVPSNPWVAVRWREPDAIRVPLAPVMAKKGIGFTSVGASRVHPAENRVELCDGTSLAYDFLVIATGPELAFDEIPDLARMPIRFRCAAPTMPRMPPTCLTLSAKIRGPLCWRGAGGVLFWSGL